MTTLAQGAQQSGAIGWRTTSDQVAHDAPAEVTERRIDTLFMVDTPLPDHHVAIHWSLTATMRHSTL